MFFKAMVNAAGIAGVSQDFNGQGRKLDEVSQSTDQAVITLVKV